MSDPREQTPQGNWMKSSYQLEQELYKYSSNPFADVTRIKDYKEALLRARQAENLKQHMSREQRVNRLLRRSND